MRVSAAPLIAAGASLAIQAVGASPIRVVAVSSHIEFLPTTNSIPHAITTGELHPTVQIRKGMACAGRMRAKQLELSNTIRKAFGMALIEDAQSIKEGRPAALHMGEVHILPMPFIPERMPAIERLEHKMIPAAPVSIMPGVAEHIVEGPSFVERIHSALTELGTWEARAVAFVLGCGIGVLLRMIWVFAVLVVREFSPSANDEQAEDARYSLVIAEAEALPAYTDEKAPSYIPDDEKSSREGA